MGPDPARSGRRDYRKPPFPRTRGRPEIGDSFTVPASAAPGGTIHVICEVTDHGFPRLTRYRRVIVTAILTPLLTSWWYRRSPKAARADVQTVI